MRFKVFLSLPRRVLACVTFSTIFCLSMSVLAKGGIDGGGGDSYSAEFVARARELLSKYRIEGFRAKSLFDINAFEKAINETRIEITTEDLVVDGIPKFAKNFPSERRIVINARHWSDRLSEKGRNALVLHEYLGIMGVDDQLYQVSSQLEGTPEDYRERMRRAIYALAPAFQAIVNAGKDRLGRCYSLGRFDLLLSNAIDEWTRASPSNLRPDLSIWRALLAEMTTIRGIAADLRDVCKKSSREKKAAKNLNQMRAAIESAFLDVKGINESALDLENTTYR